MTSAISRSASAAGAGACSRAPEDALMPSRAVEPGSPTTPSLARRDQHHEDSRQLAACSRIPDFVGRRPDPAPRSAFGDIEAVLVGQAEALVDTIAYREHHRVARDARDLAGAHGV